MTKFQDLIILIPGITGSVLANAEGKEVWGPNAGAIWRSIVSRGDSIASLTLSSDDEDDGVTPTRLVPDTTIIPGLIKIDGYTQIQETLVNRLQLIDGSNFRTFPYDWRRDNEYTAKRFEAKAMEWLHDWRKQSGNESARLILIGHSMGGLIARWFIECLGGWRVTRMLVTIGTPHRGSLNALGFIENGMKKGIGPFGIDLSPVLRSCPSVYELLPTYPCVTGADGKSLRVADAVANRQFSDYLSAARVKRALSFHHKIAEAQGNNARDEAYVRSGCRTIPIVGIDQPTAQSAQWKDGRCILSNTLDGIDLAGDGTVPRASATPLEIQNGMCEIHAAESHGAIQNSQSVLLNLYALLTRDTIDFRRFMRASDQATLTLDIDDVILPQEDVEIRARPSEGQAALRTTFFSLSTGEVFEESLRRCSDPSWQHGVFLLPPGVWRVTVSGERVKPISDTIVVADR